MSHTTNGTRPLTVTTGGRQYTRNQPLILMQWRCAVCGLAHERWQLPGYPPRYCPSPEPGQHSDCQREAARQRVRQHRMSRA